MFMSLTGTQAARSRRNSWCSRSRARALRCSCLQSESLRELLEQRLGLLEIGSIKALGKPRVDLGEQVVRLLPSPLRCQSLLRVMAARSSSDFASWRRATSNARCNQVSASACGVPVCSIKLPGDDTARPPPSVVLWPARPVPRPEWQAPPRSAPLRVNLGQQPQKTRLPDRAPRLALGRQILTDLADLLPPLAERSPRPAAQDPADRQKSSNPCSVARAMSASACSCAASVSRRS